MPWSVETGTAVISAGAAVASLVVMFSQRAADAHRSKALLEGLKLLKGAAEGYRDEVKGLRSELASIREQVTSVQHRKVEIAAQRERRLENDRKWNAAMDFLDRL